MHLEEEKPPFEAGFHGVNGLQDYEADGFGLKFVYVERNSVVRVYFKDTRNLILK